MSAATPRRPRSPPRPRFLASDRAVGITGTFVNVTGGMFPG
ncbi:hypothetical protein ABT173_28160 [Streptomyces sp. NPDC001795]